MKTLFSGLITSKTRIKIIMRLFMNPTQHAYLRELADEFDASPSHIKEELEQLKAANLLQSKKNGRQILFSANQKHPIFNELQSMVQKALGMDKILESMIRRLGHLEKAILIDDYAEGKDTGIIDLVLVGDINPENLHDLKTKTEKYIDRKIRTLVLSNAEFENFNLQLSQRPFLLLWKKEQYEKEL
jgi:AraC-like DNA-binding protein